MQSRSLLIGLSRRNTASPPPNSDAHRAGMKEKVDRLGHAVRCKRAAQLRRPRRGSRERRGRQYCGRGEVRHRDMLEALDPEHFFHKVGLSQNVRAPGRRGGRYVLTLDLDLEAEPLQDFGAALHRDRHAAQALDPAGAEAVAPPPFRLVAPQQPARSPRRRRSRGSCAWRPPCPPRPMLDRRRARSGSARRSTRRSCVPWLPCERGSNSALSRKTLTVSSVQPVASPPMIPPKALPLASSQISVIVASAV